MLFHVEELKWGRRPFWWCPYRKWFGADYTIGSIGCEPYGTHPPQPAQTEALLVSVFSVTNEIVTRIWKSFLADKDPPLVPGSILQVWSANCIYRHAASFTDREHFCASESREIASAASPWACAMSIIKSRKGQDLRTDRGLMDFVGTDPLML